MISAGLMCQTIKADSQGLFLRQVADSYCKEGEGLFTCLFKGRDGFSRGFAIHYHGLVLKVSATLRCVVTNISFAVQSR